MAIDFPASPTIGDVFIVGVVTYVWDGVKWTSSATNSPFSLGSAATPSITFINDSNTGLYSPGADQVSITTGGTERFRVDSSGRVGIGTNSPAVALDVKGNAIIGAQDANPVTIEIGNGATGNRAALIDFTGDTTYTDYGLRIERGNAGSNAASTLYHRGTGDFAFNAVESAPFVFTHFLTERARIDSSGRLLVGTSTARSDFFNATDIAPQIQLEYAGNFAGPRIFSITTNPGAIAGVPPTLAFGRSRGSTTGSATIVADGDTNGLISFQAADGSELVESARIQAFVDGTPGPNDMPGRIVFSTTADGATSPTERMRITSAGRIGLAQSLPATTVDVNGSYAANAVAVAALDIDCSLGNYFTKTINANSTFTVSNVPASRSYSFTLELTHTSGTVTWFTGVTWPNSTAPTLTTGKVHLFMFVTDDGGTTWRGSSLINY